MRVRNIVGRSKSGRSTFTRVVLAGTLVAGLVFVFQGAASGTTAPDINGAGVFELTGQVCHESSTVPPWHWANQQCPDNLPGPASPVGLFNSDYTQAVAPGTTVGSKTLVNDILCNDALTTTTCPDNGTAAGLATNDLAFISGSSKDGINPGGNWQCTVKPVTPKDEIDNAYGSIFTAPVTTGGVTSQHMLLYMAIERGITTGTSNAGFWLFQNSVGCAPGASSKGTFGGDHAAGDLLLFATFNSGGAICPNGATSTACVDAFAWQGGAAGSINSTPVTGGSACTVSTTDTCGMVNVSSLVTPWAPHSTTATAVQPNGFFEVGIDLTDFYAALHMQVPCLSTFLADTRSSGTQGDAISSDLHDYISGNFQTCGTLKIHKFIDPTMAGDPTAVTDVPGANWSFAVTKPAAKLSSPLAAGLHTGIPVTPLSTAVTSGDSIVINPGGTPSQTVTASGTAAVGATSIPTGSFTVPSGGYPANALVDDTTADVLCSGTTNASGDVTCPSLTNLAPGTYVAYETQQSGFFNTDPGNGSPGTVNSGSTIAQVITMGHTDQTVYFGNECYVAKTFEIDGVPTDVTKPSSITAAWTINSGGHAGSATTGTVPLSQVNSSTVWSGTLSNTFAQNDNISWSFYINGDPTHSVTVTVPYVPGPPAHGGESLAAFGYPSCADLNTAPYAPATVTGFKYKDINANGRYDSGTDLPASGFQFELKDGSTVLKVVASTSASINNISFTGVNPGGPYTVQEVHGCTAVLPSSDTTGCVNGPPAGWVQTEPASSGTASVTVNLGDTSDPISSNFGNTPLSEIGVTFSPDTSPAKTTSTITCTGPGQITGSLPGSTTSGTYQTTTGVVIGTYTCTVVITDP